jgi:hypothetical protein
VNNVIPLRRNATSQSAAQFKSWFCAREPRAANMMGLGQNGDGAIPEAPGFADTWLDSLARALTTIAPVLAQAKLVELNLERAKQGLPPIEASSIAPTVNAGISSELKTILWAGLALGAVIVFARR